jgi:hypothetical protein
VALPFIPSDAAMLVVQAGVVAAPRVGPGLEPLRRLRGRGWALVPLGSIVAVIFAIRYVSETADGLTYLALVAVPPLAAVALSWGGRWAKAPHPRIGGLSAAIVTFLFVLAWRTPDSLAGEGAGVLLSAFSCITLGVLLASVTPASWLKVGIVLMAAADVWLVASDLLQAPNATLSAAAPAAGLPRLQSEVFGSVSMGYGDLFIAGVFGAVLAHDWHRQRLGAVVTLVLAGLFDLLFLVLNELPATVPIALALIVTELWGRPSRT